MAPPTRLRTSAPGSSAAWGAGGDKRGAGEQALEGEALRSPVTPHVRAPETGVCSLAYFGELPVHLGVLGLRYCCPRSTLDSSCMEATCNPRPGRFPPASASPTPSMGRASFYP